MTDSYIEYFSNMLNIVKTKSSCYKLQVGAIIVSADDLPIIISTGFNGTPKGSIHCNEVKDVLDILYNKFESVDNLYTTLEAIVIDDLNHIFKRYSTIKKLNMIDAIYDLISNDKHIPESKELFIKKYNYIHYTYEIHAEQNAIGFASRLASTKGQYMFVTHLPCFSCANLIIASGISRVYYQHDYEDKFHNDTSIKLFKNANVDVIKIS